MEISEIVKQVVDALIRRNFMREKPTDIIERQIWGVVQPIAGQSAGTFRFNDIYGGIQIKMSLDKNRDIHVLLKAKDWEEGFTHFVDEQAHNPGYIWKRVDIQNLSYTIYSAIRNTWAQHRKPKEEKKEQEGDGK